MGSVLRIEEVPRATPVPLVMVCLECLRRFNLEVAREAADFFYGHDCEGR